MYNAREQAEQLDDLRFAIHDSRFWRTFAMLTIFSLGGIAGYLIASFKLRDSIHLLPEVAEASAQVEAEALAVNGSGPARNSESYGGPVIPDASGSSRSANVTDQARCQDRVPAKEIRISDFGFRNSHAHVMRMVVTAYCPCEICCGVNSVFVAGEYRNATYSGARVDRVVPFFVAADPAVIPLGSVVIVDGYADNRPVPVLDTGRVITGNSIDVYHADHQAALEWGRKTNVEVIVFDCGMSNVESRMSNLPAAGGHRGAR